MKKRKKITKNCTIWQPKRWLRTKKSDYFLWRLQTECSKEGCGDLSEISICKADSLVSRNLKMGTVQRNKEDKNNKKGR